MSTTRFRVVRYFLFVGALLGVLGQSRAVQPAATGPANKSAPEGTVPEIELTPTTKGGSAVRTDPAPQVNTAAPAGSRHALLIGVGQASFRGIVQNPLPQCIIDAKTLAATLGPRGYYCEVISEGEKIEPTAANIRDQVAAASGLVGESDQLLVYISTHGDVVNGKSVIIAKDDLVEIDWIKRHMAASKAAVKILMLDCCRNNKGFERTTTEARDVQCIMACRPDELSQVGQSGMSVFTEAMVDAIVECRADRLKDGNIELDELMVYLDREVPRRAAIANPEHAQHPTRTVVDPKIVSPIFVQCSLHDQLTFGPSTYRNTKPPRARSSLALHDLLMFSVRPDMSLEDASKAIGAEWTAAPDLESDGAGVGIVEGKPGPQEVLVVRFEKHKVALVHILYRDLCVEDYSSLKIRGAIQNLIGDSALVELTAPLTGQTTSSIIEKLGCPESALLPTGQFPDAAGELRYPDVPRPGQKMIVRIKGGKFDSIDIATIK